MWNDLYSKPFIVTTESKLRSFQYQILKWSLVTNKFLHLCKIRDNDLCYFCNKSCETIEHLFYECKKVQYFWKDLANTLEHVFNIKSYIVKKDILLGVCNTEHDILLNFIFIAGKRYIYVNRCLKREIHVTNFVRILTDYYKVEQYLANLNGNDKKFERKWALVKSIVDV